MWGLSLVHHIISVDIVDCLDPTRFWTPLRISAWHVTGAQEIAANQKKGQFVYSESDEEKHVDKNIESEQ